MINAAMGHVYNSLPTYAAACGATTIPVIYDLFSLVPKSAIKERKIKTALSGGAGLLAGAAAGAFTDRCFAACQLITPYEKQRNSTISAYLAAAIATSAISLLLDTLFPNNTASDTDNHQSGSPLNQGPTIV